MSKRALATAGLVLALSSVSARSEPQLGQPISDADIAAWDISIPPSGEGLPPGSGTFAEGRDVYAQSCLRCHGEGAAGKPADALVGGQGSLSTDAPQKTVGSYWPYATTLFDYIRRAMPLESPRSLSDKDVYAVTAYILGLNGIIPEDAVMDAASLPDVQMPNRDSFVSWYPSPPR
ncbi:MAG: cytochrome C [Rhodospirillaceae bacterium]|nr:cytochrome C [Rhodospirillaceae bacterium]|tara:strand:+ start:618 stop:1145 length:528 start_codon:yes stop_codon:yes gene_type:complete